MASSRRGIAALLAFACLAAAPDPAGVAMLRALAARDLRLATVAYRLQTAGAAHCRDLIALPGMVVQDASQYRADLRPALAIALGVRALPAITGVVPGGPADRAGLRAGDAIVAVAGTRIAGDRAVEERGPADGSRLDAVLRRLDDAFSRGTATLAIERRGHVRSVTIAGRPACRSLVQLGVGGDRNAGADGRTVTISEGLFDFARSDDELAFVVGHELAHNILGHAYAHPPGEALAERERRADYLGLLLVAWAGYDVDAAGPFLRRAADSNLFPDATHPAIAERVRALARQAAELHDGRGDAEPDYGRFAAGG